MRRLAFLSRLVRGALLSCMGIALSAAVSASDLEFRAPAAPDEAKAALQDLAGRLVPVYQDPDPDRYLANLSALQMVAGNYAAADQSRRSLQARRHRPSVGREIIFDIYARARAAETRKISFAEAFAKILSRRRIPSERS